MLNEKISKREFETVLNNNRVRVGCEFEFIVPIFDKREKERIKKINYMEAVEGAINQYDQDLQDWSDEGMTGKAPKIPPILKKLDPSLQDGDEIEFEDYDEIFRDVQIDKVDLFKLLVKDFLNIDKVLPSSSYIISSNPKKRDSNKWIIKPDGSVGLSGVEVVSPILTLKQFLEICPKMFNHIRMFGDTNDSCGFHISISLDGIGDLSRTLDVIKLVLFTDEEYIYKSFEMRKFNEYAKSARSELLFNLGKVKEFININKLKIEYNKGHDMAINIEHLDMKNKYIEFRYLGGSNYHKKWDEIRRIFVMYVYALSIGCDPEYRKKEYILKLNRIINKISLFMTLKQLSDKDSFDDKEIKKIRHLSKIINLTDQDIFDIIGNSDIKNDVEKQKIMNLNKRV